jgi:hypothetical protein
MKTSVLLIISLRKLVSDLRPIDILSGEIAIEVTGVVGVSPALWYFRYIACPPWHLTYSLVMGGAYPYMDLNAKYEKLYYE